MADRPLEAVKDKAAKSAYDRARYAARYRDRRRSVCLLPGCEVQIDQPRHGRRLYCSARHRMEAFLAAHPKPVLGPMPAPYTGHRWLELARGVVQRPSDFVPAKGTEWADRREDEMGEALLALLEGRDPKEAVREFRRREYVPRHLTAHIGDWGGDDPDYALRLWEKAMPKARSAEDEAMERVA